MQYIIKISFKNKGVENMKIFGKELTFNGNKVYHAGNKPTASEIGAAASSHTHNYAGSSSAGGAANSALTATKATQDSAGQQINTTYIKGLSVSGRTITYTKGNGTTGTITTQDTNTTYSTGTSTTSGLTKLYTGTGTATDGTMTQAAINTALSGKAASSHTHNYAGSSSAGGNANAAIKLATARTINGTSFDGSANITTANWGTARNLNGVSVNGSTNYTIPVENYYCNVNNSNTNLYHRILTTDIATASWVDKSLIIVMHSGYSGGGFGIAKITFRTNDISSAANSQGEIKWLVRNGFAENTLVFNLVNQAKNACMDIFYKSPGTYAGMTWYVLSEGGRGGNHSKVWTKYNTNASGTNAYTEANMKTLRTYASTLVSAKDAGHVSTANSASTLSTARTINGTSFNGSANITTANWGTARTLTIGNTGKSVNGSGNVSWSLSEIGAAPAGYGLGTVCQDKSNQDCNNILTTGFYMGSNMTNKPSGCTQGWIYLLVMKHNDSWVRQVAYDFGTASQVYTRVKQNGSWTSWVATDNNTWRGVQDNLTSSATDQSLSANQGKILKSLIDGKAAASHTHAYAPTSTGSSISIHADSDSSSTSEYLLLKAGHNELKIASSAGGTTVTKGQDKLTFNGNVVYHTGKKPTASEIGAAASSHTHNYAGSSSAGGAANSANTLATARTINGTSFNGSANITTANWGTARTITIGSTGKSVNGSGNVSWSLSEIGAAAASHSHSYLPLSGGTITGSLTIGDAVLSPYSYSAAKGLSISAIHVKLQGSYGINLNSNTAIAGTLDMTSNMTMGGTKFYIKSGTNYSASYFPQLTGSNIYNPFAQIILETDNGAGRFHFLNANGQPGICFSGGFTVKTTLAAYSTANLSNNKENAFDIINNFNIIEQNDSRVIVPNIQTCSNLNEDDNIETNYSKIEINNDGDAIITTNLNSMVALLIDCVKELKSEIDSLKENLPNSL